jgi:hypothetical protein
MNLAFFNFSVKMTDADIRRSVYEAAVITQKMGEGVLVSIDGYDNDPRDLWNIPEVVVFAKRLVANGVCSVAVVSTILDPKFDGPGGRPFGGFEVWLLLVAEKVGVPYNAAPPSVPLPVANGKK